MKEDAFKLQETCSDGLKDSPGNSMALQSHTEETATKKHKDGLLLRWIRVQKTVSIKENNVGLLRSSIVTPAASKAISGVLNNNNNDNNNGDQKITNALKTKAILKEVSGCALPGQVLCMMGPSGSGKTSLLNVLSGRTSYDGGIITINGRPLLGSSMRKRLMAQIAYVKQADIFFTHLTVRDQLGYTAFLRLPQSWARQRKLEEVERIIHLLRLSKVADSKISLLSGGEKKRVNIGTELLTDPSCLLLDEPTSGLDSTSAVALMKMLQELSRDHHKTVITSIHQPNSALFFSFDKLTMLAEGNVVYFGSPRDSLEYLRTVNMTCPDGYNAADHWMDLLVQDTAVVEERDSTMDDSATDQYSPESSEKTSSVTKPIFRTRREQLIQDWDNEAIAQQMDMATIDSQTPQIESSTAKSLSKYNTSWWMQYRVLVHRALKNSRSAIFTPINLIKSAVLGLISGALWFQIEYTEANVADMSSFFFFTMTYWVFDSMFNALLSFPTERKVVLKERSSGSYHLGAYFLAKCTSEMPTRLVLPLIYMCIAFWMTGISDRFEVFIFTTLISLLSVVAGEALGLLVGASIYDMEKAMTTMTVVSLSLMLLGGFFVENVPSWLDWGKFLSPFKYSFDASRQLVLDRDVPCDGSGALESLCNGSNTGSVSAEDVIDFLEIQGSIGFNVGLLVVIGIVPRYFAYWALRSKKEGER